MLLEEGQLITKGQMLFFLIFSVVFLALIAYLYRMDWKKSPWYFKGTWKVFAGLIVVIALIIIIFLSRK